MNYSLLDTRLDQMIDQNCAKADFDYGLHILLCNEQWAWLKDGLVPDVHEEADLSTPAINYYEEI